MSDEQPKTIHVPASIPQRLAPGIKRKLPLFAFGEKSSEVEPYAIIEWPRTGRTATDWKRYLGVGTDAPAPHPVYPWMFAVDVTPGRSFRSVEIRYEFVGLIVKPWQGKFPPDGWEQMVAWEEGN